MPGLSPRVYECTVTNVNSETRLLDAVSRRGRRFDKISYLLPYMNESLGSGLDFIPQNGDQCIVMAAGDGGGLEFVIGFKKKFIAGKGESGGRIPGSSLPPGSIGIRVLGEDGSEAKIIAYRGGTVVIGSGAMATTIYSPLGVAKHLFDTWIQEGPGGKVSWSRRKGSDSVEYDAEYRTKAQKDVDGFRVRVHIGSGDQPVRVEVTRKMTDPIPALTLAVNSDGTVDLNANVMRVKALARLDIDSPNLILNGRRVLPQEDPI